MLGPWLPFPPEDWAQVPEGPGVYALADARVNVLTIAGNPTLRRALQELAAAAPAPLRDLAAHLWVEATPEPERRRAELISALRARTGVFPPYNRRHPRYPTRQSAWWAVRSGAEASPAETRNVSSMGLLLGLAKPPAPPASIEVRVETPFGLVGGEGQIAWVEADAREAGIALRRMHGRADRLRWELLLSQLAERGAHA